MRSDAEDDGQAQGRRAAGEEREPAPPLRLPSSLFASGASPSSVSGASSVFYRSLEAGYAAAPISGLVNAHRITIAKGHAINRMEVTGREDLCHTGKALHGSVYFKLLDDASFFAAQSLETEVFLATTSFSLYLMRPVNPASAREGGGAKKPEVDEDKELRSRSYLEGRGKVVSSTKSLIVAEAELWEVEEVFAEKNNKDGENNLQKLVGKGVGTFQRSRVPLKGLPGFDPEVRRGAGFEDGVNLYERERLHQRGRPEAKMSNNSRL